MKKQFLVSHIYTVVVEAYSEDHATAIARTNPPSYHWIDNGNDDSWYFEEFVRQPVDSSICDVMPFLPQAKEDSE